MILIFGGTTEGRIAAEVCDKSGKPFFYSTKTGEQKVYATNINFIYGAMDCDEIIEFCKHNGIRLIIDAAHPFAEVLHHNIAQAANELGIPTIRLEREKNSEIRNSHVHWFDTLNDTIDYI